MASLLAARLQQIAEVRITQKVESNGIFLIIPVEIAKRLQQHYFFYSWNEKISEYRLMTSWDTQEEDIEGFIALLKKELR